MAEPLHPYPSPLVYLAIRARIIGRMDEAVTANATALAWARSRKDAPLVEALEVTATELLSNRGSDRDLSRSVRDYLRLRKPNAGAEPS